MAKVISSEKLSETIGIAECKDGFWLYDKTRGMNLAMRAKTRDAAFIKALTYYQNRMAKLEAEHKALTDKVDSFVSQFCDDDDGEW